jgi:hypothetical protein
MASKSELAGVILGGCIARVIQLVVVVGAVVLILRWMGVVS